MSYEKRKKELIERLNFINKHYHGQQHKEKLAQFVNSLGKEKGERLVQEVIQEAQERIEEMYGLSAPPMMRESTPHPIEEQIKKEGIPKELMTNPSIEGMIEPFRSLAIIEQARRRTRRRKLVKEPTKKDIKAFEKWLADQMNR